MSTSSYGSRAVRHSGRDYRIVTGDRADAYLGEGHICHTAQIGSTVYVLFYLPGDTMAAYPLTPGTGKHRRAA